MIFFIKILFFSEVKLKHIAINPYSASILALTTPFIYFLNSAINLSSKLYALHKRLPFIL